MFVRIKKIKGRTYAYLVENKWSEKGARQKTKKYLGRAVLLQKVRENPSTHANFSASSLRGKNKSELLAMALCFTLQEYGFRKQKGILALGNIRITLNPLLVSQKSERPVALVLNEGVLCAETLCRIVSYEKSEEKSEGYALAKYCIEAGLSLPKELFVALYNVYEKK